MKYLLLVLLCVGLFILTSLFFYNFLKEDPPVSDDRTLNTRLNFFENEFPDYCFKNPKLCFIDDDCLSCLEPNSICLKQRCTQKISFTGPSDCNARRGGFKTIQFIPETSTLFENCMCLFPEFYNGPECNNENLITTTNGGEIKDFDALKNVPSVGFQTCPPGFNLWTPFISPELRRIGYCVPTIINEILTTV